MLLLSVLGIHAEGLEGEPIHLDAGRLGHCQHMEAHPGALLCGRRRLCRGHAHSVSQAACQRSRNTCCGAQMLTIGEWQTSNTAGSSSTAVPGHYQVCEEARNKGSSTSSAGVALTSPVNAQLGQVNGAACVLDWLSCEGSCTKAHPSLVSADLHMYMARA